MDLNTLSADLAKIAGAADLATAAQAHQAAVAAAAPLLLDKTKRAGVDVPALLQSRDALVAQAQAIADAKNAETLTRPRPIPAGELRDLLLKRGVLGKALAASEASDADGKLSVVYRVLMEQMIPSFDVAKKDDADFIATHLAALVACGAMTETDVQDCAALASESLPYWRTVAARPLEWSDVLAAMNLKWEDLAVPNPPDEKLEQAFADISGTETQP